MTQSESLAAIILDVAGALRYWLTTPALHRPCLRAGPDDFGDPASIGLMVKRRGKDIPELGLFDFGLFAGRHGEKWVVIVKDFWFWSPVGYAEYESLASLKCDWTLD